MTAKVPRVDEVDKPRVETGVEPRRVKLNALWEIVLSAWSAGTFHPNMTRGTVRPRHTTVRRNRAAKGIRPKSQGHRQVPKEKKWKVQASIQEDQLRVTSPSRDETQDVCGFCAKPIRRGACRWELHNRTQARGIWPRLGLR